MKVLYITQLVHSFEKFGNVFCLIKLATYTIKVSHITNVIVANSIEREVFNRDG